MVLQGDYMPPDNLADLVKRIRSWEWVRAYHAKQLHQARLALEDLRDQVRSLPSRPDPPHKKTH